MELADEDRNCFAGVSHKRVQSVGFVTLFPGFYAVQLA